MATSINYLDLFQTIGIKLCNLSDLIEDFNTMPPPVENLVHDNLNFSQFFEPIWQKFNELNAHTSALLDLEFKSAQAFSFSRDELKIYAHFLVCHTSINTFRTTYESCCVNNDDRYTDCLSHAIYVLIKLLGIDPLEHECMSNPGEEFTKYSLIKSTIKKAFSLTTNR